jgi:hypothetical protein
MDIVMLGSADSLAKFFCAVSVMVPGTRLDEVKSQILRLLQETHPGAILQWGVSGRMGSGYAEFIVLISDSVQLVCPIDYLDNLSAPARLEARCQWVIYEDGTWWPAGG